MRYILFQDIMQVCVKFMRNCTAQYWGKKKKKNPNEIKPEKQTENELCTMSSNNAIVTCYSSTFITYHECLCYGY